MCNNKENAMNKVIDIVVDCCATDLGNGRKSLTREDVLGKRKDENICMTRTNNGKRHVSIGTPLFNCNPS